MDATEDDEHTTMRLLDDDDAEEAAHAAYVASVRRTTTNGTATTDGGPPPPRRRRRRGGRGRRERGGDVDANRRFDFFNDDDGRADDATTTGVDDDDDDADVDEEELVDDDDEDVDDAEEDDEEEEEAEEEEDEEDEEDVEDAYEEERLAEEGETEEDGMGTIKVIRSGSGDATGTSMTSVDADAVISRTLSDEDDEDGGVAVDWSDLGNRRARATLKDLNAILGSEREFKREKKREIGHLAVWSVASAKQGNGVELLRDDDLGTFWQSDGAQPHVVNAQFQHKVELCEIALWCEFKMDESYTPAMISIRAGTSCHDFKEVRCVELFKPNGWVRIRLDRERGAVSPYLRAYFIQIAVLANHQNGRDTHVRQIKIFGPRRDQARALGRSLQLDFKSPKFTAYSSVR